MLAQTDATDRQDDPTNGAEAASRAIPARSDYGTWALFEPAPSNDFDAPGADPRTAFIHRVEDKTAGPKLPPGAFIAIGEAVKAGDICQDGPAWPTKGQNYLLYLAGESKPLLRKVVKVAKDHIVVRPLGASSSVADVRVDNFTLHYFAPAYNRVEITPSGGAKFTPPPPKTRRARKPRKAPAEHRSVVDVAGWRDNRRAMDAFPAEWEKLSAFYDALIDPLYEPLAEDFSAVWPWIARLTSAGARFDPSFIQALADMERQMIDGDEDGDSDHERTEDNFAFDAETSVHSVGSGCIDTGPARYLIGGATIRVDGVASPAVADEIAKHLAACFPGQDASIDAACAA